MHSAMRCNKVLVITVAMVVSFGFLVSSAIGAIKPKPVKVVNEVDINVVNPGPIPVTIVNDNSEGTSEVISVSVSVQRQGTVILFKTPPASEGRFMLTQICIFDPTAAVDVRGNTFGNIIFESWSCSFIDCVPASYTTYSPGIALPPNETTTCYSANRDNDCMMTGVLYQK